MLWFTGGGPVEGWFDTRMYDGTGDEPKAQGWTVFVLDTNGNGKRDAYVEPDQAIDPARDKRINAPFYGVAPSPLDGSVWGSVMGVGIPRPPQPRFEPSGHRSVSIYEVPWNNPKASAQGFAPRGMDVDNNGVVWTVLSSGHTRHRSPQVQGAAQWAGGDRPALPGGLVTLCAAGPELQGSRGFSERGHRLLRLRRPIRMLGVGKNVPLATGNGSEGLLALVDGKFLKFRVPYPMGFYAKGMDGRSTTPRSDGKGKESGRPMPRELHSTSEGGKGTTSKLVKFQVRTSPLDK